MITFTAAQVVAIRQSLTEAVAKENYITAKVLLEALLAQPPVAVEAETAEIEAVAGATVEEKGEEEAEDSAPTTAPAAPTKAPAAPTKAPAAPTKAPRAPRTPDEALEERVLRFLRENPDGASLEQIRTSLGLPRKPENEIRSLIASNKVYTSGIKRGTKYHPVLSDWNRTAASTVTLRREPTKTYANGLSNLDAFNDA